MFFLPGRDPAARRPWGAFDRSGLLNRATDTFLVGGENGLVYLLELHTDFDPVAMSIAVAPRVVRYRFRAATRARGHRELPRRPPEPRLLRRQRRHDPGARPRHASGRRGRSTPATTPTRSIVVDLEDGAPFLYTASEVDLQGERGLARLRKLDGLTGRVVWVRDVACRAERGAQTVDAGVFATPLVGRGRRRPTGSCSRSRGAPSAARWSALAKADGRELWTTAAADRRVVVTDRGRSTRATGKTWILQGDRAGRLHLLDAADGRIARTLRLDGTIEASPAVFDDLAVVGTRAGTIYGIRLR